MNNSDIISVNPAQTTLGSIHLEMAENLLTNSVSLNADSSSHSNDVINFAFASRRPGNSRYNIGILMLRLLFAAVLIVSGSFILIKEIPSPTNYFSSYAVGLAEIIIGGMLAAGILSRFAAAVGIVGFGFIATNAILAGVFNSTSLMMCLACVAIAILGSGRISCDYLVRKAIINYKVRRRERLAENRMSYRAYRYSPYRSI
ncbi:MAG: DoxX family protein [Bacteroides sp.]|nr:DoxX family protein [Bacteroides sp.]